MGLVTGKPAGHQILWRSPAVLLAAGLAFVGLAACSSGSCGHASNADLNPPGPWTTTPSLFPHLASHRAGPSVALVLGTQGDVHFGNQHLGKGSEAVTARSLEAAHQSARWVVLRTPELPPTELLRWLHAIKAAGFEGVGFWVHGPSQGQDGATLVEERFYRFAQNNGPPAWVEVLLGPRRAAVVSGSQPPVEARNGTELFVGLGQVAKTLDWDAEGCVTARVLAPISTEHLLNGLAVAGSAFRGMGTAPQPKDRVALIKAMWTIEASQARCVTLALPEPLPGVRP